MLGRRLAEKPHRRAFEAVFATHPDATVQCDTVANIAAILERS